MGDCIRVTVRHEGLGALSKGLTASLAGIVPFCALDLVSRHIHCPLPPSDSRRGVTALQSDAPKGAGCAVLYAYFLLVRV